MSGMTSATGLWYKGARVRPSTMHYPARLPLSLLLMLALAPAHAADGAAGREPDRAELATDRLNRSEACGQCHTQIYKAWQDSAHARSFSDSIFQAALEKISDARGLPARRVCLACHAPAALVSGDFEVSQAVTREGIGCDFCHSVKAVDLARWPNPFEVELGGVKRGPFAFLSSPAHETELSTLHRDSPRLCAACHEFTNDHGTAVLSTYTEWKDGPYPAEGVSCQGCHMSVVPGDRVRTDVAAAADQRVINLHRLVGGSSLSQIRRGVEAAMGDLRREAGQVVARVEVRNVAAGHKVPTGLPAKRVRLVVSALQKGKEIYTAERVYERVLVNESGKPPASEGEIFLDSKRVKSDTRLAPREKRTELFRFPAPPGEVSVRARLLYEYQPLVSVNRIQETIQEIEAKVPR